MRREKFRHERFAAAFAQNRADGADKAKMVGRFVLPAHEFDFVHLAEIGEIDRRFTEETVFPVEIHRTPGRCGQRIRADKKALVFGGKRRRGRTGGKVPGNGMTAIPNG